jgi:hypothetical protein
MLAFWPEILRPILCDLAPDAVVEIGSESGKTTRLLVELVRSWGGRVHAIDPAPRFDVDAWTLEHAPTLVCHRNKSLDALPTIDRLGAVLIDGDHNWYTVYNELRLVERRAGELGRRMPIVFLHDTAWPYGRRDLYYDADAIPEAYRHPHARLGIHPSSSALVESGGINAHLCNAMYEGGVRNGVLTAIEDYLATRSEPMDLVRIPAAFGLVMLVPGHVREEHAGVAALLSHFADPNVERFIERLELARIATALPPLP